MAVGGAHALGLKPGAAVENDGQGASAGGEYSWKAASPTFVGLHR
jgi:hypothetical protein